MKTLTISLLTISMMGAAPLAFADDFMSFCQTRTAEHFPAIEDAKGACSCIESKASPELLEQMQAAETPANIPDAAKEIMTSCGYEMPPEKPSQPEE